MLCFQVSYKKIETNQLMGSIQLGIHDSVGGLAKYPERYYTRIACPNRTRLE
jgi:hypothetical protein